MPGNGNRDTWHHCRKGAEPRHVMHVALFTFSWQCSKHCLFIAVSGPDGFYHIRKKTKLVDICAYLDILLYRYKY